MTTEPLSLGRVDLPPASDQRDLEQFLYREAMLLDDKRWDEWLDLFTEDGIYWVPSVVGQQDPIDTVSLFYENKMLREMRVIRLRHPRAFSQDFPTRTSHVIGSVMVDPDGGRGMDGGMAPAADLVVRSSQHVLEYRKENQRMFGGTVRHWLVRDPSGSGSGGGWKIALKRIDLINCDAPMEVVQLFL